MLGLGVGWGPVWQLSPAAFPPLLLSDHMCEDLIAQDLSLKSEGERKKKKRKLGGGESEVLK